MAAQTAHQQEAAAERGMADRDVRIYMNLPLYWLVGLALYSVARDKPDLFHDIRALN